MAITPAAAAMNSRRVAAPHSSFLPDSSLTEGRRLAISYTLFPATSLPTPNTPRSRISRDEEPIMIRTSPGSTTHLRPPGL